MPRQVSVAPAALQALRAARRWLCRPGAGAAGKARWRALRDAPRSLQDHPYLGVVSEQDDSLRQLVVSSHRLIYQIYRDTGDDATAGDVRILEVFGPGRN